MKFLAAFFFGVGVMFLLIVISCVINRKTENTMQILSTTVLLQTILTMVLFYEVIK